MLGGTVDGLGSADFYRPAHQLTFEAIEALRGAGKPADPIAVADELRRRGNLSRSAAGLPAHLHRGCPDAAQAAHYAAIVRELAERRAASSTPPAASACRPTPVADLVDVRDLAADPLLSRLPAPANRGRRIVLTPRVRHRPRARRVGVGGRRRRPHPGRVARASSPAGKAPASPRS